MFDAHAVLGLDRREPADPEHVRRAYKAACVRWHPDKNPDTSDVAEKKFKEVQIAFRHLMRIARASEDGMAAVAEEVLESAAGFVTQLEVPRHGGHPPSP